MVDDATHVCIFVVNSYLHFLPFEILCYHNLMKIYETNYCKIDYLEENIKTSFALKKESKALLELAKKAVEVAIEEGEDVAMRLLDD